MKPGSSCPHAFENVLQGSVRIGLLEEAFLFCRACRSFAWRPHPIRPLVWVSAKLWAFEK